jgi:hypothetical protein
MFILAGSFENFHCRESGYGSCRSAKIRFCRDLRCHSDAAVAFSLLYSVITTDFKQEGVGCILVPFCSGTALVAASCNHIMIPSGSTKYLQFLD